MNDNFESVEWDFSKINIILASYKEIYDGEGGSTTYSNSSYFKRCTEDNFNEEETKKWW